MHAPIYLAEYIHVSPLRHVLSSSVNVNYTGLHLTTVPVITFLQIHAFTSIWRLGDLLRLHHLRIYD